MFKAVIACGTFQIEVDMYRGCESPYGTRKTLAAMGLSGEFTVSAPSVGLFYKGTI